MIQPIKTHFQTDREYTVLAAEKSLPEFYKARMSAEGLFLKGFDSDVKLKFKGTRPEGTHIFEMEVAFEIPFSKFSIYTTPSYHSEIEYELINQKDGLLLGKLLSAKQTSVLRSEDRNQKVYGSVIASNFLIAKTNIDLSKLTGVSSQVILSDIHRNLLKDYPNSRVVFSANMVLGDEVELIKESKKPIYIINTNEMQTLKSSEFFDLKTSFEEDFILEDKIAEYKRRKMDSFLMYPIFIRMNDLHFFAYLTMDQEKNPVPYEVYEKYKEVERTFQERIMDSNTHIVDIKQNIFNVSRGGLSIEVREREIIKALKVKPTMTLDVNFKMQAPLRMAVELKHMEEIRDYFVIGCQIVGLSGDKKAKDIYYSLITFFS